MTKIYRGFDVLLIHSYLISCCLIVVVGEQHISPSEELVVQHRFDVVSDGGKQKTLFFYHLMDTYPLLCFQCSFRSICICCNFKSSYVIEMRCNAMLNKLPHSIGYLIIIVNHI